MEAWLGAHPLYLPVAMFVFNCVISNMPDPDLASSKGYKWLYGTLHMVVGGLGNVLFASKTQQLPAPVVDQPPVPVAQAETAAAKKTGESHFDDLLGGK
jgi:hypothetical protein